jgi:hypothetical protein
MTRRTAPTLAAAALLFVLAAPLDAAPARPDPLLTASLTQSDDGGVVMEVESEDLVVRKVVYPDGRFAAELRLGRDRLVLSGDHDGVRLARGSDAIHLPPGAADQAQAQRARAVLAASPAVRTFRQLVGALEHGERFDGAALSLRATGALLAELDGDGAAARRFSQQLLSRLGSRVRRVAQTYPPSCWSVYERAVVQAANELEQCLADFAVYNPARNLCAFVWVLKVEAAWFGLLKCSAVPLN